MTTADPPRTVAAVDLGSNSFHMIIARSDGGPFEVLDRMRERVRIAAGIDEDGRLLPEARARAFACLERFGQRLRDFSPARVRAVGTNTFRRARNGRAFRTEAQRVLGLPIEIVSGGEEARLIYLGVCRSTIIPQQRRLIIDIGGGSTEIIVGEGDEVLAAESVPLGCVSHSLRFFPNGKVTEKAYRKATIAARLEMRPIEELIRNLGWEVALGSAGTLHSIQTLVRATGDPREPITRAGLRRLRESLIAAKNMDAVEIPGLSDDRRPVLPGGLAVAHAIIKACKVQELSAAVGGLREGILHDLVGRLDHADIREATIQRFLDRFGIDHAQSERVERTAMALLDNVAEAWDLGDPAARQLLSWSARLHEIGLSISHQGHHKHGEYLVRHSQMAGFSNDDQEIVATLIRSHRRKTLRKRLIDLPNVSEERGVRLCLLLRLAVLLNRGRRASHVPVRAVAEDQALTLQFPLGFLSTHPLTTAELEGEMEQAARLRYTLVVEEDGSESVEEDEPEA